MLAPHIKKKVDELWNRFWAAGLTNPLVAVEQITYLLFLKRLEDIDKKRADRSLRSIYALTPDEEAQIQAAPEKDKAALREKLDASSCRWSYIRQEKTNPVHLIDKVFPWLRTIDQRLASNEDDTELASLNNRMADAYFQLDPNKGKVLSDAINAIDQLFARAGEGSAAQDIMGDTFEYLLSEMATAGKNGQFRTPRHLIRFMVELLDPEPGQRVIDPAAGTGGFLFSTQQYLMRKYSAQENLVLEWDGTPHRTDGAAATPEQYAAIHNGANFVGLDNDRTMARIGWMNLVLHDIHDPHLYQADSLSKRDPSKRSTELLTPEHYDFVLANPPFTGTVDSNDLEKDSKLFPRAADKGKKKEDALTNKSELLFLWLMLDLLRVGGRCAVIIPEGVLFGNTDAHVRLRRELLTEHVVEGVISLPGGVFQPYTGVKTSILVFRKETRRDDKQTFTGAIAPRTEHVWFYDVKKDGYSDNAKRNPLPGQQNDLWDALEKFKLWLRYGREGAQRNEKILLQPRYWSARWRQALLRDTADKLTPAGEAFSSSPDISMWDGRVWAIHELFPELPENPRQAMEYLLHGEDGEGGLENEFNELFIKRWATIISPIHYQSINSKRDEKSEKKAATEFNAEIAKVTKEAKTYFESDNSPAREIWETLISNARSDLHDEIENYLKEECRVDNGSKVRLKLESTSTLSDTNFRHGMLELAKQLAKLDGFDVTLRSLAVDQVAELKAAKHWVVPVRAWARNDEWRSDDAKLIGSHDADGLVRPAYVAAMLADGLYDEKGALKDDLLDPDCIEARDWNLSAGQYKPFDFTQLKSDKSVVELIGELKATEQQIINGLDKLLAMLEGRE